MMSERLTTLDSYVQDAMQSWQAPGVALAVIHGDEVLHAQGYGAADVENKTPITLDTNFAIASITKTFTAMGVALLVDEGVVEWDKPVRNYMPEFKLSDDYIGERLTLRDMLSHRSGLPRHDLAWYNTDFTREELVHNLRYLKFSKGFREGWQYQNLMYVTAGYLCGKLTGQTWEDFVQSRIFDALGLKRTCFSAQALEALGDYALPYKIDRHADQDDQLVRMPFYENSVMGPAGSIHSNLNDLIMWVKVHLNEGKHNGEPFVSPGNLTPMHTPQMIMPADGVSVQLFQNTIFAYGMGWFIRPYRGYTIVEHGGNIDGFSLNVAMVPQARLGVVTLSNIEARPLRDVLMHEVIDRVLDLPDGEWNTKYHRLWDAAFQSQDQEIETANEDQVENTTLSHPLDDYVGDYAADGYADFRVKREDEQLFGWLAGQWWALQHYHYDVFRLDMERFEIHMPVNFHTDNAGRIASLSMPVEPEVDDVRFIKKPPSIEDALLNQLVGIYDTPFDGLQLDVRLVSSGTLVAQLTGTTPMTLIPYRVTSDQVEFTVKDRANDRLEFQQRDDGLYDQVVLKTVGQAMTATRIGS